MRKVDEATAEENGSELNVGLGRTSVEDEESMAAGQECRISNNHTICKAHICIGLAYHPPSNDYLDKTRCGEALNLP